MLFSCVVAQNIKQHSEELATFAGEEEVEVHWKTVDCCGVLRS